jgi:PAP2 superfamily
MSATTGSIAAAVARPAVTRRATWADVGCSRFALLLLAVNVGMFALGVAMFQISGLSLGLTAKDLWDKIVILAFPLAMWGYYAWIPGRPREWIFPQAALVFILVLMAAMLGAPMQYAAAALNRPPIDPVLAQADAWLGISVPALVSWTAGHPWLVALLHWSYFTLVFQLPLPVFALPWWNDSEALWEFAFHVLVCNLVTIAAFALWPAACVFQELGFESLIDQTRFIAHFAAARDGSMTTVPWGQIEGLVSVPSFHMVGAVIVAWACRRTWLVWLLVPVNVLLIASTVLLGAHYAVDLVASGLLLASSFALYRWARGYLRGTGMPDERRSDEL